jgi:haloalkane dehalogenase
MGQSGKSPTQAYRFVDHTRYLDAWFEALHLTSNVTLVVHDWGSALGFHRAFRYPRQIKAIAYMEAIAMPLRWEDFGEARGIFQGLRSSQGEQMILDGNFFVEAVLPRSILRKLSDHEMAAYRAPFLEREARLPTLVWPRQIPVEGEPADVSAIVESYGGWLCQCEIPKLLIVGQPGAIIRGRTLEFCRSWGNQTEVRVKGLHFLQEDSPDEIGEALQEFVTANRGHRRNRQGSSPRACTLWAPRGPSGARCAEGRSSGGGDSPNDWQSKRGVLPSGFVPDARSEAPRRRRSFPLEET